MREKAMGRITDGFFYFEVIIHKWLICTITDSKDGGYIIAVFFDGKSLNSLWKGYYRIEKNIAIYQKLSIGSLLVQ